MADSAYNALSSVQQVSVVQELTTWFHNWFHKSSPVAQICESEKDDYELASIDEGFEDVESNLGKERDSSLLWLVNH